MNAYFVGYYGFGNAGDEHLLRQSQSLLKADVSHVLPSRRLWGLWDMGWRIPRSDWVVFGGGSLFQDRSSRMSLTYYLLILTWACLWRRYVLIVGHGLGPIGSRFLSRWLSLLLPRVGRVVARDAQSHLDFLALGASSKTTVLGVDLAYLSGPRRDVWVSTGPVVLSVKGMIPDMFAVSWSFVMTEMPELTCLWVGMHAGHDATPSPFVQMSDDLSLEATVELAGFSGCISMRYHACVWASLRGIPFLAVGDDPKLQALARTFGQPIVSLGVTLEGVHSAMTDFLNNREMYRQSLLGALPGVLATADQMQALFPA
jgi:polysaccharide pyruvyl transferase WcaK-like protein